MGDARPVSAAGRPDEFARQLARTVLELAARVTALEAENAKVRAQVAAILAASAPARSVVRKVALPSAPRAVRQTDEPEGARLLARLPALVRQIVEEEAARVRIEPELLMSRTRCWPAPQARSAAMARTVALGRSLVAVGRLFDRDHSTVRAAVEVHAARIASGTAPGRGS